MCYKQPFSFSYMRVFKTPKVIAMVRRKYFLEYLAEEAEVFGIRGDFNAILAKYSLLSDKFMQAVENNLGEGAYSNLEWQDNYVTGFFLAEFLLARAKVYHIAEEFGRQLYKAPITIDTQYMPEPGWTGLIEFPDSIHLSFGSDHHRSAFVRMGYTLDNTIALQIVCPDYSASGGIKATKSVSILPLFPGKTLQECLDLCPGEKVISIDTIAFIVKCLLYIKSAKPDLESIWKPCLTKNPKKVKRHSSNYAPFPIEKVGFGFHGKSTHVDTTSVSGHFRWQRVGPQLMQVKLIWIDEHERHYK